MSRESIVITERHLAYVVAHAPRPDAFTRELRRAAEAAGIPPIWISHEQGVLMQILLRLRGARDVVEVGTLAGLSAILMARALPPDGRVRTIEVEPRHARFAREWIGRSDVAERIEVVEGDARSVLPAFADASADACFVDADKEGYPVYVDECLRILRPRGLLMVDNAFGFGRIVEPGRPDSAVAAIAACNDALAARDDLEALIVPLGDGCWVGVKLAEAERAAAQ